MKMLEFDKNHDLLELEKRDLGDEIRIYLRKSIKGSSFSREQIAERMSFLTGKNITKAQLDSWTAESKQAHYFPAIYLPAFVVASGSDEIINFMCNEIGGVFIRPDNMKAELIDIEKKIGTLDVRRKEIMQYLLSIENKKIF